MKKQEILDLWNKTLLEKLHPRKDEKPKFRLGETIKIVTEESNLGSWTWMDDIRKKRKGQIGVIIDIGYIRDHPIKYSGFDYRIKFKDSKEIFFAEEHLER